MGRSLRVVGLRGGVVRVAQRFAGDGPVRRARECDEAAERVAAAA